MDECIRFARQAGYRTLTLWTQSELAAARRLYQDAGFRCVHRKPHRSFGRNDLVAETWDLTLVTTRATRGTPAHRPAGRLAGSHRVGRSVVVLEQNPDPACV